MKKLRQKVIFIFMSAMLCCSLFFSLKTAFPVSAAVTMIPYTPSADSLTTDGKYLRLNLRNVWNGNCEDVPQAVACSDFINVTFTISGLGKLTDPYTISLLGTAGDLTFWNDASDTATAGTVHVSRDGTYNVRTILPHAVSTMDCLLLATNINLYQYAESGTVADAGISITVQQITTETTNTSSVGMLGDPNGDATISVEDAVLVLTYYAKQSAGLQPDTESEFANIQSGDVDRNGVISVEDAVSILTYYARQSAGLSPDWGNG